MYDISKLERWIGRETDVRQVGVWRNLLHDFGDVLPFLIDEKFVEQIPAVGRLRLFKKDALGSPSRTFKTYAGAAWVLMAHLDRHAKLPDPFFKSGFLFPLEWKKAEKDEAGHHSGLLPPALLELADKVKQQFADNGIDVAGFYLHPWHGFRGTIDFSRMAASFDSAWGALATGLFSVSTAAAKKGNGMLANWPFSSIAFDFGANVPAPVSHLAEKIAIAARYGASEIAVAPNQRAELREELRVFKIRHRQRIGLFRWRVSQDLHASLRNLLRCNQGRWDAVLSLLSVLSLAVGAVLVCLVLAFAVDNARVTHRYFQDYADCWGVPKGIGELGDPAAEGRAHYYRFEYSGLVRCAPELIDVYAKSWFSWLGYSRVLRDVRQCASEPYLEQMPSLCLPRRPDRIVIWNHDSRGFARDIRRIYERKILQEEKNGNVHISEHSERDLIVDEDGCRPGGIVETMCQSGWRPCYAKAIVRAKDSNYSDTKMSRVAAKRLMRNRSGFVVNETYFDRLGNPTPSGSGAYGVSNVVDAAGRILGVRYLDSTGSVRDVDLGVAGIDFVYSDSRLLSVTTVNREDKPIVNNFGWVTATNEYDVAGNLRSVRFLNDRGNPIANGLGGFGWYFDFDAAGRLASKTISFLYRRTNYPQSYATIEYEYDENGWLRARRFKGPEEWRRLMLVGADRNAVAEIYENSLDGKRLSRRHVDAAGKTVGTWRKQLWGFGWVTNLYFDCTGRAAQIDGCYGVVYRYDGNNVITNAVFVGADGVRAVNGKGVSEIRWKYDAYGNEEYESMYDVLGNRCLSADGISGCKIEYDALGRITQWMGVSTNDLPCAAKSTGCAIVRKEYSSDGRITMRHYDASMNKICVDGTHEWVIYLDQMGMIVTNRAIGVDGQLVMASHGAAERHFRADRQLRSTFACSYDTNGVAIVTTGESNGLIDIGAIEQHWVHNEHGQLVKTWYSNADGSAYSNRVNGIWGYECEYDADGRLMRKKYYDRDFGRILWDESGGGRGEYDERGRLTRILLNAEMTNGVVRGEFSYYPIGECKKDVSFFANPSNGCLYGFSEVARETFSYDIYGNVVDRKWFNRYGREIEIVPVIRFESIDKGKPADLAGIRAGDICCRYGDPVLGDAAGVGAARERHDGMKLKMDQLVGIYADRPKQVVVARKDRSGYVIAEHCLGPEKIWARYAVVDIPRSEYDKIKSALAERP